MKLEKITDKNLVVGIEKSLKNSKELIEEGDILFNENRICRAYCLYQLAVEEVGKSNLLFTLLMNRKLGNNINYNVFNRDFAHHQTKSKRAIIFEKLALLMMYSSQKEQSSQQRKASFIEALKRLQHDNDVAVLNKNKNNSLYVGIKDNRFFEPSDVISKQMASELRQNVLIRYEAGKTVLNGG